MIAEVISKLFLIFQTYIFLKQVKYVHFRKLGVYGKLSKEILLTLNSMNELHECILNHSWKQGWMIWNVFTCSFGQLILTELFSCKKWLPNFLCFLRPNSDSPDLMAITQHLLYIRHGWAQNCAQEDCGSLAWKT